MADVSSGKKLQGDLLMEKIFDSHVHIYPDAIAEKAVAALGKFYDFVPEGLGTRNDYIETAEKAGCKGFFVLCVATNAHQVRTVNDYTADTVKHSRRMGFESYGFMGMHQDFEDFESEIIRCKEMGFVGMKIHPDIQRVSIDDVKLEPVFEVLEKNNMILYLHMGDNRPEYRYSEASKLAMVAKKHPKLRFGAAHFGGYESCNDAIEYLAGLDNVWYDCSSSLWNMTAEKANEMISKLGQERIMFATDYPVKKMFGELELFDRLNLNSAVRSAVMWENAQIFLHG